MDLWPWTVDARHSLLVTFEELDDEQWAVESLCEGWSIREVLAHLILAARPPARRYLAAIARARGNFDKANQVLAVADGRRPTAELVAEYRSVVNYRFSPPGWPQAAPLSDILLHSLDVRLALGVASDQQPERYEPVMGLLFGPLRRSFTQAKRPSLRWVATDHSWTNGTGPAVEGAIADLAFTAAGRRGRIDQLSGEGVPAVRLWLS